jgi:hypothetical protein
LFQNLMANAAAVGTKAADTFTNHCLNVRLLLLPLQGFGFQKQRVATPQAAK